MTTAKQRNALQPSPQATATHTSLFICGTPFQLFLSLNIITAEQINPVSILYLGDPDHEKAQHYLSLFPPKTLVTTFWIDHELQHLKKKQINQKAQRLAQQLGHHHSVFIANYTILFYAFLLSHLPHDSLYSFDDGADNINPLSPLYQFHHQNHTQKLSYAFKYALRYRIQHRLRLHPKKILNKIKWHYTIFPQHQNIIRNTRTLKLQSLTQPPQPTESTQQRPVIKLFIGAYFSDMFTRAADMNQIMAKLEQFSQNQQITHYLPHPRENAYHLPNIKHIHTLAEEYILAQVAAGYKVALFGFGSTAQLNLASTEHVTNHLLTAAELHPKIRFLYQHVCDDAFEVLSID
ncbi:MAG: hypothetical protein KBC57_11185 [Neisseriaceae bacterium]|nr:hypothetical protein [Neisseriaceae bacterium]